MNPRLRAASDGNFVGVNRQVNSCPGDTLLRSFHSCSPIIVEKPSDLLCPRGMYVTEAHPMKNFLLPLRASGKHPIQRRNGEWIPAVGWVPEGIATTALKLNTSSILMKTCFRSACPWPCTQMVGLIEVGFFHHRSQR